MRKFSKILASLLVVMLLVGVLAVSVLAAAVGDYDTLNQLSIQDEEAGITTSRSYHKTGTHFIARDFQNISSWLPGSGSGKMTLNLRSDASGNNYFAFYNDGTSAVGGKSAYQDIDMYRGGKTSNSVQNPNNADDKISIDAFIKKDFFVFDYDLSSDHFVIDGFYTQPAGLIEGTSGFAVYEDGGANYQVDGQNVNFTTLTQAFVPGTYLAKDAEGYAVWTEAAVTAGFKDNSGAVVVKDARLVLADGTNMQYSALKLAYMRIAPLVQVYTYDDAGSTRLISSAISTSVNGGLTTYDEEENRWYISLAGTKVALSNNVGEWNHITLVFKFENDINYIDANGNVTVDDYDFFLCEAIQNQATTYTNAAGETVTNPYTSYTTNLADSRMYGYLNGEYVGDAKVFKTASQVTSFTDVQALDNLNFYVFRFQAGGNNSTDYATIYYRNAKLSHCYDNFAAHWYKDGYTGDLANHIATDPTQPIYNLNDIVYKGTYDYPTPNVAQNSATYEDAEGVEQTVSFDLAVGAIDAAIINSGYATISSDVKNYSLPEGQKPTNFFVKMENGATLTLAEGTGYLVSEAPETQGEYAGCYKVYTSPEIDVLWFASEEAYLKFDFEKKDTLKIGDSLIIDDFEIEPNKYIGGGKFLGFVGWAYSVVDDDDLTMLEGDVLTQEIFDAAMDEDEQIYIVPVYGEIDAALEVEVDGVKTGYLTNDDIEGIFDSLTDTYKITLYDDVNITITATSSTSAFFTVAAGETATVDLNGHTIMVNFTCADSNTPNLFMVRENATLNIYSSQENGTIFANRGVIFRMQRTGTDSGFMQNAAINLGEAANPEFDGDNLTITCGVLLEVAGDRMYYNDESLPTDGATPVDAEGNINWEVAAEFNVKGGFYHRHKSVTYAMICARGIVKINVEDSKFLVTAGRLLSTDSRSWCETKATFKNSEVACTAGSFIAQLQGDSELVFDNCKISGSFGSFDSALYYVASGTTVYKHYDESISKNVYYFSEENAKAAAGDVENYYEAVTYTADTQMYNNVMKDSAYATRHNTGRIYFTNGTKVHDRGNFTNTTQIDFNGLAYGYIAESFSMSYNVPTPDYEAGTLTYQAEDTVYTETLGFLIVDPASLVSGIKANLTTNNGFYVNFYIPAGTTALGIYTDVEMTTPAEVVAYNGEYDMIRVAAPAGSTDDLIVYIKIQANDGSVYAQGVKLSLLGYFNAVLNDEEATETEKALVVNAANYCNELYKVANSKAYSGYTKIITNNPDLVIVPDTLNSKQETLLPEVVTGATFIIGEGNVPAFAFTVAGEGTVTASYTKLGGEAANVTLEKYEQTTGEGDEAVTVVYYVIKEMAVYDMLGTVTVSVNGEEALVYSINDYINNTEAENNAVATALYGYAMAVIDYKLGK